MSFQWKLQTGLVTALCPSVLKAWHGAIRLMDGYLRTTEKRERDEGGSSSLCFTHVGLSAALTQCATENCPPHSPAPPPSFQMMSTPTVKIGFTHLLWPQLRHILQRIKSTTEDSKAIDLGVCDPSQAQVPLVVVVVVALCALWWWWWSLCAWGCRWW